MTELVLAFLIYSPFCWWVVFRDGADYLKRWKAEYLFDWIAPNLSSTKLINGVTTIC
jgi:hypothetical protein